MKEELYLWIRNLAVFYIFFTAVLNLIPDRQYEKYVRFFMGLLLIFMMSTPMFSILGKGPELTESFLNNFSEENKEKELREFQNLQKVYLEKGCELELEQKIRETLEKRGIEIYKIKVNIEGAIISKSVSGKSVFKMKLLIKLITSNLSKIISSRVKKHSSQSASVRFAVRSAQGISDLSFGGGLTQHGIFGYGCTFGAVSYTHLDVYKRQAPVGVKIHL